MGLGFRGFRGLGSIVFKAFDFRGLAFRALVILTLIMLLTAFRSIRRIHSQPL